MRRSILLLLLSGSRRRGPRIHLSGLSIAEDAAGDTVIGTASVANGSGSYTFSITSDPDSKFQIINDDELALGTEATLDYETATSHLVTIEADNGVDDPISRQFTISVTNVIEAPVNVTPPAVTGSLEVGSTLSCSTGTWTDMGAGSYAYQWKDASDDSSIEDATASTLLLTHALIDVELYCEVTATNSGDSTAEDSNTVGPVVDTTAPVLSGAAASGTGYTTGSASVSTNEGNGTLYLVVTSSATQPSAAQIKAGDDHADADAVFADDASVSATGAQDAFSVTGLSHTTTYYAHFMHEDAEGNQSAVSTASFQTTAAAVPDAFEVGDWDADPADEQIDITINSLPADNGAAITDIEYRLDGGSWVSSGGTSSFTISSLTNDQEYDVELRAVNSVGAGAASDVKQVTPEDATPAWSPLDLGADLMMWLPLDDPAELWQASDGTTAVSADNDPIGRAVDQSANARHANQATSGARPRFRTGTPNYAEFGPDDYLEAPSNFNSTQFGFAARVYRDGSQTDTASIFDFWTSPFAWRVMFNSTNKITVQARNSNNGECFNLDASFFLQDPNALPNQTWTDVVVNFSATAGAIFINGSQVRTQNYLGGVGLKNPNGIAPLIGRRPETANYFNGRLRNLVVVNRPLTQGEIDNLVAMP